MKFESGAMRFSGEKSPGAGAPQNISFHPGPSIKATVKGVLDIFKIAQNTISEVKERQYTAGKVIQRFFSSGPCMYIII